MMARFIAVLTLISAKDPKFEPEPLEFTVSYDKPGLNAFIHSQALAIPQHPQEVKFLLNPGVKAKGSEASTLSELYRVARVPGLYDERMVANMQLTVAPNVKTGQQEQILIVNTAVPVHEQEMAKAIAVWQLPEIDPDTPEDERDKVYASRWFKANIQSTAQTIKVPLAELRGEQHYGLSLALGGGEVTMEELAELYALLVNQGVSKRLNYCCKPNTLEPLPLLSPAPSFITLDMLKRNLRPPTEPEVAWKTGTSWGFRDAWSAGASGR